MRDITAGVGAAAVQARLTSTSDDASLAGRAEHRLPVFVAAVALAAAFALAARRRAAAVSGQGRWKPLRRFVATSRAPPARPSTLY